MSVRILQGDCLAVLKTLPDESVHCVVTSPPYWGLRDYGTARWEGGDPACDHKQGRPGAGADGIVDERAQRNRDGAGAMGGDCGKCGAHRIDSQLGLESTPQEYIEKMVAVFREVRRVLRSDGTLWLNMGDCYATGTTAGRQASTGVLKHHTAQDIRRLGTPDGLKTKDLVGMPWRLALALQRPYYTGTIREEGDRIWLAAMIDGEGCIYIHRRQAGQPNGQGYERKNDTHGAGLEISNTNEAIVLRCLSVTGRGSISRQDKDRRQPLFRWCLRTNECREVIREVYPHLVAKQQQARIVMGCPASGDKAEAAFVALKGLHHGVQTAVDFDEPASMFEPGWFLRQDLIWSKPNPMPESVRDRCTKAHEYLFLLAKSERYYFDAEAIAEAATSSYDPDDAKTPDGWDTGPGAHGTVHREGREKGSSGNKARKSGGNFSREYAESQPAHGAMALERPEYFTRNKRSVWTVTTQPFKEAHFATFPPALIGPCILAGCPPAGKRCDCDVVIETPIGTGPIDDPSMLTGRGGMNRPRRPDEGTRPITRREQRWHAEQMKRSPNGAAMAKAAGEAFAHYIRTDLSGARPLPEALRLDFQQRGWITDAPPCTCPVEPPGTVLDPFGGAGTTGLVADRLGRNAILIELNPLYADMARKRIVGDAPLFAEVA